MSPKTGQLFKVELFSGMVERKAQKGTRNNDHKKTTVFGGIQGPCGAGGVAGGFTIFIFQFSIFCPGVQRESLSLLLNKVSDPL
jgi:hypothetical protein